MLTQDIVEAIARGHEVARTQVGDSTALKIEHGKHRVGLRKSKGSNAWTVTAFELYEGAGGKGYDNTAPTDTGATLSRADTGAPYMATGSEQAAAAPGLNETSSNAALERAQPKGNNHLNDTQAHSRRGRSLGADDNTNVPSEPIEINTLRQAIEQAVGKNNMRHIEIVAREDVVRPDNAQDLLNAQGWYNPKTQRITLISEALPNERTAQFVAWHELGHRKIDVDGWQKWQGLFRAAYNGNAVIKQAADHIYKQRRGAADGAGMDKFRAVEEAVADLYAATQTGDYAAFEQRNGAKVPLAMRDTLGGYLSRLANHLRTVLAKVMGAGRNTISDADIYGWLKQLDKVDGETSGSLNNDAKFSRAGDLLSQAKQKVVDLVRRLRENKGLREQVDLMPVSEIAAAEAAEHGMDIAGYIHMLDSSAVNHVLNNHGNAKSEAARGQIGIKDSDFAAIVNALENPDKVIYGPQNNAKKEQIAYISKLDDGSLLVLQEQRVGKRKLALMSMRKYPATVDDGSIIRTLLPNARSDGGNALSIVNNPAPRNTGKDTRFSRQPKVDNQKSAYESARAAGQTELTFKQWQEVRTPEFKRWFGDWKNDPKNASKVINPKTGEPLVMYHGTSRSQGGDAFNQFDTYCAG